VRGASSASQNGRRLLDKNGDDFISNNYLTIPNVIKIDVEGAELEVLKGLEDTIKQKKCRAIFCEVHPKYLNTDVSELINFLTNKGFESKTFDKRRSEYHILFYR